MLSITIKKCALGSVYNPSVLCAVFAIILVHTKILKSQIRTTAQALGLALALFQLTEKHQDCLLMVYRSVPNHTQYTCPVSVLVFSSHSLSTKVSELGYFLKKNPYSANVFMHTLYFFHFFFFFVSKFPFRNYTAWEMLRKIPLKRLRNYLLSWSVESYS